MKSVWDKVTWAENQIGLYGFDIMPDARDKLWLLEVNKCPSMEESTAVTEVLVPQFMEDLCRMIIDRQKVEKFQLLINEEKIDETVFEKKCKNLCIFGTKLVK